MRRLWTLCVGIALLVAACDPASKMTEVQHVKSGDLDVVLLSASESILHEQGSFVIEFRSAGGALIDVGDVKMTSTMPMPGMPMMASLDVRKTATPGRYDVASKFDMAGTWRTTISWQGGPGGSGFVTFSGSIQ